MLGKKESDQIIKQQFGEILGPLGLKWVAKADCFLRKRDGGVDIFAVGHVNYTTVQKIGCTMGIRFDRAEEIRDKVLGYPPLPSRATISTPLDYYAGRPLEWECSSAAELEAAIAEITAKFLPKVAAHYERYRDPIAMLSKVDDRNGDQPFAIGDDVFMATGGLILYSLYARDGFDERLKGYRQRFTQFDPEVMAPFETVVTWLRAHPELRGQS